MLVLETKGDALNPATAFFTKVKPAIEKLEHVKWCNLADRWISYDTRADTPHHHNLKQSFEFRDAVERYSYLAKTNDKTGIPKHFKRTFETSRIIKNKYYSILGNNNMFKYQLIKKNHSFNTFINTPGHEQYKILRQFKHDQDAIKQVFHITDINSNAPVGYYGLSHCIDDSEGLYQVFLSLDDVYANVTGDQQEILLDGLYLHLHEQLGCIFDQIKHDAPDILTVCHNERFSTLFELVVSNICDERDIEFMPCIESH